VSLEFTLYGGSVTSQEYAVAKLACGMNCAFNFGYRGFVAPHRVYCNGDHWRVSLFQVQRTHYSVAVSMTSRPLYWPQWGHTRWGTLGSWQLGHSACAGLLRESWARRFCVRAFECRRFGFGIAFRYPSAS
jgi:hypothetical protein